jgi:hypothetical protein
MTTAVYLLCLARSDLLPAIEGTGVDGQNPLFLHRFLDVTAVVSMVSLEEFSGPLAESRMQDLSWVGPRACRHEEVVEQVVRLSAVLPARFGTIFHSLESLEMRLKKHHGAISKFLDQVADKEEWAVKGLLDRAKAKEELFSITLAKEEGHLASLSPGMRYFQEQRMRAGVEKELNSWLKEVYKELASVLIHYASGFCERRVFSREATGNERDMVLNWAFLVPRGVLADFRAGIDRANTEHARHGLVLGLTGPWPPYSFSPSLEMDPGE